MTLADYINIVEEQHYEEQQVDVTEDVQATTFYLGLQQVEEWLQEGRLGIWRWHLQQPEPITVSVEIAPLNIPMLEVSKMKGFFAPDDTLKLNIYATCQAEHLNASHFRIDYLTSVAELMQNPKTVAPALAVWVTAQLTAITTHLTETED